MWKGWNLFCPSWFSKTFSGFSPTLLIGLNLIILFMLYAVPKNIYTLLIWPEVASICGEDHKLAVVLQRLENWGNSQNCFSDKHEDGDEPVEGHTRGWTVSAVHPRRANQWHDGTASERNDKPATGMRGWASFTNQYQTWSLACLYWKASMLM